MTNPFFNNFFAHHQSQNQTQNNVFNLSRQDNRSKYMSISNPQKLINPFSLFKGFMSGTLKEENQNIFPAVSTFNYFKNISEVIYDKNRRVVSAFLENDPIWASTSWTDVVETMGHGMEIDRIETSKVIDTFGSSMEELNKLSEKLKDSAIKTDFGLKKQDFDNLKSEYEKSHPTFYIKNVMKHYNPTVLEYNAQFLSFLGYNPSDFASNILRHGVPEIYPNMQKKYASMVKEIIAILIKGQYDGRPIEKEIRLLHSNLQVSCVVEKIFLMRSFNKDNDLEIEIFSVFEPISESVKIEEEIARMPQMNSELPASREKEREEFLKKFYNIKKKDSSDAARTCRIRFL
jgi:hypothetical protein